MEHSRSVTGKCKGRPKIQRTARPGAMLIAHPRHWHVTQMEFVNYKRETETPFSFFNMYRGL